MRNPAVPRRCPGQDHADLREGRGQEQHRDSDQDRDRLPRPVWAQAPGYPPDGLRHLSVLLLWNQHCGTTASGHAFARHGQRRVAPAPSRGDLDEVEGRLALHCATVGLQFEEDARTAVSIRGTVMFVLASGFETASSWQPVVQARWGRLPEVRKVLWTPLPRGALRPGRH